MKVLRNIEEVFYRVSYQALYIVYCIGCPGGLV